MPTTQVSRDSEPASIPVLDILFVLNLRQAGTETSLLSGAIAMLARPVTTPCHCDSATLFLDLTDPQPHSWRDSLRLLSELHAEMLCEA